MIVGLQKWIIYDNILSNRPILHCYQNRFCEKSSTVIFSRTYLLNCVFFRLFEVKNKNCAMEDYFTIDAHPAGFRINDFGRTFADQCHHQRHHCHHFANHQRVPHHRKQMYFSDPQPQLLEMINLYLFPPKKRLIGVDFRFLSWLGFGTKFTRLLHGDGSRCTSSSIDAITFVL